ncbi:MAG: hypothetical protein AAFR61_15185 [Bacteroidota bacterium]
MKDHNSDLKRRKNWTTEDALYGVQLLRRFDRNGMTKNQAFREVVNEIERGGKDNETLYKDTKRVDTSKYPTLEETFVKLVKMGAIELSTEKQKFSGIGDFYRLTGKGRNLLNQSNPKFAIRTDWNEMKADLEAERKNRQLTKINLRNIPRNTFIGVIMVIFAIFTFFQGC